MSQISKDRPWLIRTYAGHSTAAASNQLYRSNLAKGQTGCLLLSTFLPKQAMTVITYLPVARLGKLVYQYAIWGI